MLNLRRLAGVDEAQDAPHRGSSGLPSLPQVEHKSRIAKAFTPEPRRRHPCFPEVFFNSPKQHHSSRLSDSSTKVSGQILLVKE